MKMTEHKKYQSSIRDAVIYTALGWKTRSKM
jgi:hypothetical protein